MFSIYISYYSHNSTKVIIFLYIERHLFPFWQRTKINIVTFSGVPDFTSGFQGGSCCPVICLIMSCYILVFWILSFDCSFCLIAWYLYFLLSDHSLQLTRSFISFISLLYVYFFRHGNFCSTIFFRLWGSLNHSMTKK